MRELKPFWWYTEESKDMLERGYLIKGQTIEEKVRIKAKYASEKLNKPELEEPFYNMIAMGWTSLSSPIWANFGEGRGLPISCFSSYVPDSIDGIFTTAHEVAVMTQQGGGTSGYFPLRPKGAPIKGGGASSGAVSFVEIFDTTIKNVSQSGVRRGGFAGYMDIDHPEIKDFLRVKDKDSTMQSINTAVNVTDDFMKRMIAGDKEARSVWAEVLKSRREKGIPYIHFVDNVNNNAPDVYKDKGLRINQSNLCVGEDTLILTDCGYLPIGDLENQEVNVWNGEQYSNTVVRKTGTGQQLLRVQTDSGYVLDCTAYHKFYIQEGYVGGVGKNKYNLLEKRANELVKGDRLIKFDLPVIEGCETLDKAYTNGFYSGDGCYHKGIAIIYVYEPKKSVIPFLELGDKILHFQENQKRYCVTNVQGMKEKFFVPDANYTIESRLNWLAGLLDADGTVTNNNGSETIQIASTELSFLQDIQLMLQTLGCDSKVVLAKEAGYRNLPANDGSGDLKPYFCKKAYRLLINGNSLFSLIQLGIKFNRLVVSGKRPNRKCSNFIKIESVTELEGEHDTFCFTEPLRNKGMFNGILTGNCNEIELHTSEEESLVCCLSSLNLATYHHWKDTNVVELMVYFLDAVLTDFIEKTEGMSGMQRARKFAINQRAIGIGVLGWSSFLQQEMIPFESPLATAWTSKIFKQIQEQSLEASKKLAKELGEPELLKGYGRRNATLMAVAPTTSSSAILGQVSPGIEPYKSNYYTVGLAKGSFSRFNTELKKLLIKKGMDTHEVMDSIRKNDGSVHHLDFLTQDEKDVFKTFKEINPTAIIEQASVRQKYIDQGQSLNLLIPHEMLIKDINALHIKAWELGIKGLYYQRGTSVSKEALIKMQSCESCSA